MRHIIQGGRYMRQAGADFNPYTYDDIKTIALPICHYIGATPHSGNGRSDSAGGGHAHAGLMCYQGGLWPKEYWGSSSWATSTATASMWMSSRRKARLCRESQDPDFLLTNDSWSIPLAIKCGPDGNAYLIDWYDKQICHLPQPEVWDRTNGRMYRSHTQRRSRCQPSISRKRRGPTW